MLFELFDVSEMLYWYGVEKSRYFSAADSLMFLNDKTPELLAPIERKILFFSERDLGRGKKRLE